MCALDGPVGPWRADRRSWTQARGGHGILGRPTVVAPCLGEQGLPRSCGSHDPMTPAPHRLHARTRSPPHRRPRAWPPAASSMMPRAAARQNVRLFLPGWDTPWLVSISGWRLTGPGTRQQRQHRCLAGPYPGKHCAPRLSAIARTADSSALLDYHAARRAQHVSSGSALRLIFDRTPSRLHPAPVSVQSGRERPSR